MIQKAAESILAFPSDEHVTRTCRPGQGEGTCRYLVMGQKGWECAKVTSLRRPIDERVAKGEMGAKGDNCAGLLAEILAIQDLLKGKRAFYVECLPTYRAYGTLRGMEIKDGMLCIYVEWDPGSVEFTPSTAIDYLQINVQQDAIDFSVAGLGLFAGKTTIFLDE